MFKYLGFATQYCVVGRLNGKTLDWYAIAVGLMFGEVGWGVVKIHSLLELRVRTKHLQIKVGFGVGVRSVLKSNTANLKVI